MNYRYREALRNGRHTHIYCGRNFSSVTEEEVINLGWELTSVSSLCTVHYELWDGRPREKDTFRVGASFEAAGGSKWVTIYFLCGYTRIPFREYRISNHGDEASVLAELLKIYNSAKKISGDSKTIAVRYYGGTVYYKTDSWGRDRIIVRPLRCAGQGR